MDENWVEVYSESFVPKAELIKNFLEQNGIATILMNQRDSSHNTFGEVRVMVQKESLLKAINLINEIK